MKTENEHDEKESFLLCLFRKLYDQQFPRSMSCFKLISIEERIEDLKEEDRIHNKWLIRISYILVAILAFNFQFANHLESWKVSQYHSVVTWITLICGLLIVISVITRFLHYAQTLTIFETDLARGGFYFYKETEESFLNLIQKFTWYDIKSSNELASQMEKDVRFLVYLIKKGEAYPDDKGRNPFLKKFEDDLLRKMLDLICMLCMMGVKEADDIIDSSDKNVFEKRAEWLRKKLFDEVTI